MALHAATARTTCALIEESEEAPPLAALAARAGYARHHFLRLFREVTGLTPYGYEAAVRVRRLSAALVAGERVVDAVTGAGFGGENPGSTQATRARWAWPLARSAVVAEAR